MEMKEMELFKLIKSFLAILLQNKKLIKTFYLYSLSPELQLKI